jgi:hypothetical protein
MRSVLQSKWTFGGGGLPIRGPQDRSAKFSKQYRARQAFEFQNPASRGLTGCVCCYQS